MNALTFFSLGMLTAPCLTHPASAEPTGATPLPLQSSPIVHRNKSGGLAVASANGNPIDGIKVPTHDLTIQSPSMVVAPDGVIHIAFLQQVRPRSAEVAIYHSSSADGGKTWTPAKNLSEIMPDLNVGACRVAADAAGRVYVIWNVGAVQYDTPSLFSSHGSNYSNLVYRVLSGGQWSGKAIPVHQMETPADRNIGSLSYFVTDDSAGNVRVVWNEIPIRLHPEVKSVEGGDTIGGLVMEATLNGTTASAPHQVYLAPVSKGQYGPAMDGLDMLTGYVDAANQTHLLAESNSVRGRNAHFLIMDQSGATPGVDLPGGDSSYWYCPPTLLLDAQGRKHIVTMYKGGEHEHVCDYVAGSDSEPTTIRSSSSAAGTLKSLEAIQGPAGHMLAIMDMNDKGGKTDEELYVSMSSGGAWSPPINVTNNSGHLASHSTATSSRSSVTTMSWGSPGAATGTFDKSGHLLLLYVRNTVSLFGVNAVGVELAGGSTATPNLMFLRF